LSREQAAAYLGISPGTFNLMVDDGRMPAPKVINTRLVWDRLALDQAFEALPDKGGRAGENEDERWRCAV
jgi:excisionase family DNA binding protein